MARRMLVLIGMLALLAGCGSAKKETTGLDELRRLGPTEYLTLGPHQLALAPAAIAGTGRVVVNTPITRGQNNFDLRFSLQDGGKLTFVVLAKNDLTGGLEVTFERGPGDSLRAGYRIGAETFDISGDFPGVKVTGPVRVEIDVHDHPHFVVWWNGRPDRHDYTWTAGMPTTKFWGLSLEKASVTQAQIGPARSPH